MSVQEFLEEIMPRGSFESTYLLIFQLDNRWRAQISCREFELAFVYSCYVTLGGLIYIDGIVRFYLTNTSIIKIKEDIDKQTPCILCIDGPSPPLKEMKTVAVSLWGRAPFR